jgi:hypothetical protein
VTPRIPDSERVPGREDGEQDDERRGHAFHGSPPARAAITAAVGPVDDVSDDGGPDLLESLPDLGEVPRVDVGRHHDDRAVGVGRHLLQAGIPVHRCRVDDQHVGVLRQLVDCRRQHHASEHLSPVLDRRTGWYDRERVGVVDAPQPRRLLEACRSCGEVGPSRPVAGSSVLGQTARGVGVDEHGPPAHPGRRRRQVHRHRGCAETGGAAADHHHLTLVALFEGLHRLHIGARRLGVGVTECRSRPPCGGWHVAEHRRGSDPFQARAERKPHPQEPDRSGDHCPDHGGEQGPACRGPDVRQHPEHDQSSAHRDQVGQGEDAMQQSWLAGL